MTLSQVLLALKAHLRIILMMTAVTTLAAVVVTAFLPRSYIATAAVVADVKYADPIAGAILPALTQPGYMATQLDIIQSNRVAERVVKMLKLDEGEDVKKAWMEATGGIGTLDSWMAGNLRGMLDAKPAKDSSVIALSVKSGNPKFATQVANAFAQAYIDVSLDLRVEPARRYTAYFEEQAGIARDRLEKAQTALSNFQRENSLIVTNDERYDVETTKLTDLSAQLSVIQGQRVESQSRVNQAQANSGSMQEVLTNPLVQSLKSDLAQKESRLQEMSGNLGANNPKYLQAQAEADSVRRKLAAETAQITSGISTSSRVLAQRESEVAAEFAAQKARVLKLKQDRDAAAVLQRDVDAAQHAFDAVLTRVTQSNLESSSNQTNLSILNPAIEPSKPSSPRVAVNIVVAVIIGLILGIGMALLLEQLDRRVRSADDLAAVLGLSVLGVLPGLHRAGPRLLGRGSRAPRLGASQPALT
jgi:chain length determinant protein EpsF